MTEETRKQEINRLVDRILLRADPPMCLSVPEALEAAYELGDKPGRSARKDAVTNAMTMIAFLKSCVQCGESLSAVDEAKIREVCQALRGLLPTSTTTDGGYEH